MPVSRKHSKCLPAFKVDARIFVNSNNIKNQEESYVNRLQQQKRESEHYFRS